MLIPKCCKGCLNRNSGFCNCVLPLYCNEFVEEDETRDINTNITYIDMLRKESSELLVNSLTEKDKKIAELQKQLEEKEKRIKELDDWKANYGYTNYEDIYMLEDLQSRAFQSEDDTQVVNELLDYLNISDENEILPAIKQQLKAQPAEIVEKIRKELGLKLKYKLNDEISVLKICNQINEVLDAILKEYLK